MLLLRIHSKSKVVNYLPGNKILYKFVSNLVRAELNLLEKFASLTQILQFSVFFRFVPLSLVFLLLQINFVTIIIYLLFYSLSAQNTDMFGFRRCRLQTANFMLGNTKVRRFFSHRPNGHLSCFV